MNLHIDEVNLDPLYGVEACVNIVMVMPEIIIRPADIDFDYTTVTFMIAGSPLNRQASEATRANLCASESRSVPPE